MPKWTTLDPVDILYGADIKVPSNQRKVLEMIETEKPDFVTLAMPCRPWGTWSRLADSDANAKKRTQDLPLWRFTRKVWDAQMQGGR